MTWPAPDRESGLADINEHLRAYQHAAASLAQRQNALMGLGAAISAWQLNQLTSVRGGDRDAVSDLSVRMSRLQEAVALLQPVFAGVDLIASGVTVLAATDPDRGHADGYPADPDRYVVYAYGGSGGTVWADGRSISPQELAVIVRADPRAEDKMVVLVAADTGSDPDDGYAAQLARHLPGVRIAAPTGGVHTTADGDLAVSVSTPDATLASDGQPEPTWRVFSSRDPQVSDLGPILLVRNPFADSAAVNSGEPQPHAEHATESIQDDDDYSDPFADPVEDSAEDSGDFDDADGLDEEPLLQPPARRGSTCPPSGPKKTQPTSARPPTK